MGCEVYFFNSGCDRNGSSPNSRCSVDRQIGVGIVFMTRIQSVTFSRKSCLIFWPGASFPTGRRCLFPQAQVVISHFNWALAVVFCIWSDWFGRHFPEFGAEMTILKFIPLEYTAKQSSTTREVDPEFLTDEALQRARQLPIFEF